MILTTLSLSLPFLPSFFLSLTPSSVSFPLPLLSLSIQEQASWVCRCEDRVVQQLEQDFKLTLQQQNSLEQWAAWLDGVVSQVLKPYQASAAFPKAAKLFLLKWSFYR